MIKRYFFATLFASIFALPAFAFEVNKDLKNHKNVPICDHLPKGIDTCVIEGKVTSILSFDHWMVVDYQTKLAAKGRKLIEKNCKLYGSFVVDVSKQSGLAMLASSALTNKHQIEVSLNCTARDLHYAKKHQNMRFAGPLIHTLTITAKH